MSRQGTKKVAKKVERPGLSTEEVDEIKQAFDLFDTNDAKLSHKLRGMVNPSGRQMVVTPKEIDLLVNRASELIALSINYALHPNLSITDLMSLMY